MGLFLGAIIKYPNRAFLTRARPDLKDKAVKGYPLLGNMPQMLKNSDDSLGHLHAAFKHFGDFFSLTIPLFGRVILVNTPEHFEHVLKSKFISLVVFTRLLFSIYLTILLIFYFCSELQ